MGKYIHWFEKTAEFEKNYWGEDYINPWLSYTEQNNQLSWGPRDEDAALWHEPLTFEILSNGNIGWNYNRKDSSSTYTCNSTIQYSKNGEEWTNLTNNYQVSSTVYVKKGDIIKFRGDNSVYCKNVGFDVVGNANFNYFSSTCNFNVSGNITSLINSSNWQIQSIGTATFSRLFYNCTGLKDASDLRLVHSSNFCYAFMFYGCTGLTKAPSLPSTSLEDYCYRGMFFGCSNLTTGPQLPATTLAPHCYREMFRNCTKLITAPTLSATTLATACYERMFSGCTTLISTPELPAMTVGYTSYKQMFENCTNLTNVIGLPATTLDYGSYTEMFTGCSSLQVAPNLPATSLTESCYEKMFYECQNLEVFPTLTINSVADTCCSNMFYNCKKLILPSNFSLPATTLATACYQKMFWGCESLQLSSNFTLPATTLAISCYDCMFRDCTNLEFIPTNILSAVTTLDSWCYSGMFYGCTKITSIPNGLLPVTTLVDHCYNAMFRDCTSLTSIPNNLLPATTLQDYCYSQMFYNCSKLQVAPALPAPTLVSNCYNYMFYGCRLLTAVTCLATANINTNNSTTTWLGNVNSTGVLTVANPTIWPLNSVNGKPNGWTIVAPEGTLILDNSTIICGIKGLDKTLTNYTNTDFTIVSNTGSSWLTVNKTVDLQNNSYTLQFIGTESNTARSATVQIRNNYNNETANIVVNQVLPNYTIDLNNAWIVDENQQGTNGETVYKSNSSYHVNSGSSTMYITITGYYNFKLRVRTYGQSNYDYLVVSKLDVTPVKSSSNSNNQWSGYGKASASQWYDVEFTNIDGGQHVITLLYGKNATTNSNDDRAYVYIPSQCSYDDLILDYNSQSATISGYSTSNWTAITDSNWFTISPLSGNSGIFNITVTATENVSGDLRTGTILFNNGETYNIQVTQSSSS